MENIDYLRPIIADADTGCVLCLLPWFVLTRYVAMVVLRLS